MAKQDSALTAEVMDRSHCVAAPLKREAESLSVSRLAEWLKGSVDFPPARRASVFLVANAYVACNQLPPQRVSALGAKFAASCPQDGPVYSGNFREEAENLDPKGRAGELAGLASLGEPCSLEGHRPWPDLVIAKGERLFNQFPPDEWTPWIHYAVARADAAKLSFAYSGGDPEGGFSPLTPAAMRRQREAAIPHFEAFIREKPNTPEAVFAWQESWRLLAGLPPSEIHFGCGCE